MNEVSSRRFEGRVGIVTGAGSGIGAATSARLAAEGARLAVFDIDGDAASRECGHLRNVIIEAVDVGDPDAVDAAVARVAAELGRLDFLAHIAGVDASRAIKQMLGDHYGALARGEVGPGIRGVVDLTNEEWRRIMSTNLDGTFYCTRAALRIMIEQRAGAIVTTSSTTGVQGAAGVSHYAASKGGVRVFTQAVAREVAPFGIRVNTIAPGPTETAMLARNPPEALKGAASTPLGRSASPSELAAVIAFLLSDEASYIVGETCNVNGGMVIA